ncbi:MAG: E3 binding domain-containing protein, partial [Sphingorhabdus sp.]|nr:E3 binding domain-containing protein [Sphingorhabdus sp.]
MSTEVKVPVLGESIVEATLGQWLKKPGDPVALDEPIASLETDKVAVEVGAPVAGVMGAYLAQEGDNVNVGAIIASIEAGGAVSAPKTANDAPASAAAPAANIAAADHSDLPLSPAVRRLVLELGIDPTKVTGSGKDGRLSKEDVIAYSKTAADASALAAAPNAVSELASAPKTATTGRSEERVRMTRLRQTVAKRLKTAQETAALLTTFNDVDMSAVIEARAKYKDLFEKKHGVRL